MNQNKSFPWTAVILGVGCAGVICIGAIVLVGGGVVYTWMQDQETPSTLEPVMTVVKATPTIEAALQPTPLAGPVLTGKQQLEEFALFDDFSSDALGWPIYDDGKTIMQYENGMYSIQITEPAYIDWAYFPIKFSPYEIQFDVQGSPGEQDGTFGVLCQYQDVDNHYYVEFNLQTSSYIVAQYLDGVDIALTKQNTAGQFWYETDALNTSQNAVNNIGVGCYLSNVILIINNQLVDNVNIPTPFTEPGNAAFFVYTLSSANEDGYKIYIDNVNAFQPQQ